MTHVKRIRSKKGQDMNRRITAAISMTAIGAIALLAGCAPSSAGGDGKHQITVGIAMASALQPRWKFDVAAMQEAAKGDGVKTIVQYANLDPAVQANQVQAMVNKGIDVLIINPVSAAEAGTIVSRAASQGVKVISYDQNVDADVDYNVTRSLEQAGQLQIDAALKAVPHGNYALIKGDNAAGPIAATMADQYAKAIDGSDGNVSVVYQTWTANWDPGKAQDEAEAALTAKDNKIDAFVVSNDGMATGVIQALKGAHLAGKVFVSGMDADEKNLAYIASGEQSMTVYTDVEAMGKIAMTGAVALASGKSPQLDEPHQKNGEFAAPTKFVPILAVTKSNLCEFLTKDAPKGWANPAVVFGGASQC